MNIAFSKSAWRRWEKLPETVQEKLRNKLEYYAREPLRYAVKLSDSKLGSYRFRIGDYRIIFDIDKDTLTILDVGHRKEIYR